MKPQRTPVNISLLTRSAIADFEPLTEGKHIDIKLNMPGDLCVDVDQCMYERILFNLVLNAVSFNTEKGSVIVTIEQKDNRLKTFP